MPDAVEPDAEWLSVRALAKREGVSQQAVSKRIARLVAEGKLVTRPGKGRARLVDVAQYVLASAATKDERRALAAETAKARRGEATAAEGSSNGAAKATHVSDLPTDGLTYSELQRQKATFDLKMRALDFGERIKLLVPRELVREETREVADAIIRALQGLRRYAPELTMASAFQVRAVLRRAEFEERKAIAAALRALVAKWEGRGPFTIDIPLPEEQPE